MSRARTTEEALEIRLFYRSPDGASSMVFYVLTPGIPTRDDCQRAANAATQWDIDGASPGTSYRLFRTSASALERVRARSIDPRSAADWVIYVPADVGAGAESVSDALPDMVGPIMRWNCLPGQRRRQGRTYCPCLCHNVTDTARPDRINDDARGPLRLTFEGLITLVAIENATVMVLLTSQENGHEVRPCPVSVIESSAGPAAMLGTQRRRRIWR